MREFSTILLCKEEHQRFSLLQFGSKLDHTGGSFIHIAYIENTESDFP
jgi:hypothetical protein